MNTCLKYSETQLKKFEVHCTDARPMRGLDSHTFSLLDKEALGLGHAHHVPLLITEIIPSHILLRNNLPCVALFDMTGPFNLGLRY
jgi:hypothetical protein